MAAAVVTALVVAFTIRVGNETGAVVIAVAGLILAAASTLIDLVTFLRSAGPRATAEAQADALASVVDSQWLREADARGLRDGDVLPLSWKRRDGDTTGASTRVSPRDTGGRLYGDFASVIRDLATGFHTIPGRRLVLLGEPGAGKTVVGLLLTLGMVKVRVAGEPVPLLLSISSWDPVVQSLDAWLIQSVADSYYGGKPETARELVQSGMIVPILDGLDEIPESSRRHAIGEINRAIRQSRPVIVTCRLNEYRELIVDGSPALSRAPVIEVQPVALDDLVTYYSQLRWPGGVSWSRVFQQMTDERNGALATAFSTPLIISLARLIMAQGEETPDDLLDDPTLESRHSIENWLTSRTVKAAYASGEQPTGGKLRRRIRAERHLGYLAQHMHAERDRELTWWLLSDRLLPAWFSPVLGLVGGLVSMVAVVAAYAIIDRGPSTPSGVLAFAAAAGLVFAILLTTAWSMTGKRPPRQLLFRSRDGARRWRAGFRSGTVPALLPAAALIVTFVLFISIGDAWSFENLLNLTRGSVALIAVGVASGVATGVLRCLEGSHEKASSADPLELVRRDRRSSLLGAALGGVLFGALLTPFVLLGLWLGGAGLGLLSRWPGWPGVPDLRATFDAAYFEVATRHFPSTQLGVTALYVLPGLGFAVLTLISRPWPRYIITCTVLAAAGRLPWHLSAFLDDAYRRGVLRRSGGMYQFRHGRLQEHLALMWAGDTDATRARWRRPPERLGRRDWSTRRTKAAYALMAVLVLLAGSSAVAIPRSNSLLTLRGQYAKGPYAVTFSPSGALIALRSDLDPWIHVFNAANGESQGRFPGHLSRGADSELVFGPTDKSIAIVHRLDSISRAVSVWDLTSGSSEIELPLHDAAPAIRGPLQFGADGSTIAVFGPAVRSGAAPTMTLWDIPAHRPALNTPYNPIRGVPLSPDQKSFVTVDAGRYLLRRMSDGRPIVTLGRVDPNSELNPERFSRDGTRLMMVSDERKVTLWNTQTGAPLFRGQHKNELGGTEASLFSPDSRTAIVVDGADAKVVDAARGNLLGRLRFRYTTDLAMSTDGSVSGIVGWNGELASLDRSGRSRRYPNLPEESTERTMTLPQNGKFLVASANGADGDGRAALVKIFDTHDGRMLLSLKGVTPFGSDGQFSGNVYPPEPQDDVSETIGLHTVRKTIEFRRLADGVRTFEILSPDRIATTEVQDPCCTFMTDRLVVRRDIGPSEHNLTVYDTTSGRTVATVTDVIGDSLITHGTIISVGSDHVIRVRNVLTGKVTATFRGHTGGIEKLTLAPDGKCLASSSLDGTVRIWSLPAAVTKR